MYKPKVKYAENKQAAMMLYLFLGALFITALITCNLIANKFITVNLGFKSFVISAGVLPYPITFLITDILSEIYGRKKTDLIVYMGFAASLFVIVILYLGGLFPAIDASLVSDDYYNVVFQNSWRVILASMAAYLSAQLIDIRLYHFWKKRTNGKHLWLRNNGSTILSQFVDTSLVVLVLFVGELTFDTMGGFILDGWFFKVICALGDTLFIYLAVGLIRRKFKLEYGEEVEFL